YAIIHAPRVTHDYGAYYKFSRALIEGRNIGSLYNSTALNDPRYSYEIAPTDISYNPPTNAFTLLPFAWMNAYDARIAWSVFCILLFLWTVFLLFRTYHIPWKENVGLGILTLIFLWYPVYNNIYLGQLYLLLLFLFTLSLWGVTENRPFLTSIPIALAILLKGYGIVPLLWLMYNKRWKESLLAMGFVVIFIACALPVIGTDTWLAYYHAVFVKLGQMPSDSHVAYQAVNNFMHHLFTFDKDWSPYPVFVLPVNIVMGITVLLNLLIVGVVIVKTSGRKEPRDCKISYSAAIAVGVVTAPLAFEYHYILFLPLAIGLLSLLYNTKSRITYNTATV
ncbi:MAG: glycosyltransferase family 87 protein, partial [Gloeomargaritales cyanobacterium]